MESADDNEALIGDADADAGANNDMILEKKDNKNDEKLMSSGDDNTKLAKENSATNATIKTSLVSYHKQ